MSLRRLEREEKLSKLERKRETETETDSCSCRQTDRQTDIGLRMGQKERWTERKRTYGCHCERKGSYIYIERKRIS